MVWTDEVVPIIRVLINDYDSPVTYSDNRLIDTAIIAAQLLLLEISFSNTYTITISTCTISPDPILDDSFINMVSMKSACLILSGEAKTEASNSVKIIDGPSTIDLSGRSASIQMAAKKMQEMFDSAKLSYLAGNSVGAEAIVSPYTYER